MAAKNPRLNITFEPATVSFLTELAKQEDKSVSSLAKELILDALERREDIALSALAEAMESQSKKTVSHDDAWK